MESSYFVTNTILSPSALPPRRRPTVRVASIQCSSDIGNTPQNVAKLLQLCEFAATTGGAKIIILPECSLTGYISQDYETNYRKPGRRLNPSYAKSIDPTPHAIEVGGSEVRSFCDLAHRVDAYITLPFLEIESEDERDRRILLQKGQLVDENLPEYCKSDDPSDRRFFNTLVLVGPEDGGSVRGHYRKNYPWVHPEQSWATPGTDLVTVSTPYGRVGLAICFDIHEIAERYAAVTVSPPIWSLLYVIAWVDSRPDLWFKKKLPNHLAESGVGYNVLSCNWSVEEEFRSSFSGYGFTTLYDARQNILNRAKSRWGTEIVYAEVECADEGEVDGEEEESGEGGRA